MLVEIRDVVREFSVQHRELGDKAGDGRLDLSQLALHEREVRGVECLQGLQLRLKRIDLHLNGGKAPILRCGVRAQKTAKALGLTISPSLVVRTDQVIQ